MRRPAEQTKLLFVYFLRSTAAALATPRGGILGGVSSCSSSCSSSSCVHGFGGSGGIGGIGGIGCINGALGIGSLGSIGSFGPSAACVTNVNTLHSLGTLKPRKFSSSAAVASSSALHQTSPAGVDTADSTATSSSQLSQLSSSSSSSSPTSSSSSSSTPLLQTGHITFRLARRSDVPQIQKCNLATLPENYNSNFYLNHMRQWPELALVAEHIPEGLGGDGGVGGDGGGYGEDGSGSGDITPLSEFISNRRGDRPTKEIVGYVLGKVEERPVKPPPRRIYPRSRVSPDANGATGALTPPMEYESYRHPPLYNPEDAMRSYPQTNDSFFSSKPTPSREQQKYFQQQPQEQNYHQPLFKEKIGHVTSLAVHSHARRLGIASSLLHQLHYHLQHCHGANAVGLHVRISNKAAVKLYVEGMGYDVADIIPMYYGDGEDAYFMRKDFDLIENEGTDSREVGNNRLEGNSRGEIVEDRGIRQGREIGGSSAYNDSSNQYRNKYMSEEERAWFKFSSQEWPSSQSSFSGRVSRSFRSFWGNGDQRWYGGNHRSEERPFRRQLPPWESGPEELRLPRYCKVVRPEEGGEGVNGVNGVNGVQGSGSGVVNGKRGNRRGSRGEEMRRVDEEEEDNSMTYSSRIASESV